MPRSAPVLVLLPLLAAGVRAGEDAAADPHPEFHPVRVVRPFPAIVEPPAVPADRIGDHVTEEELVLGVVVDGEARAYPINMLTGPMREIVNDRLGGRAIAATW